MKYNIRGYHSGLGDQLMWSTIPEYLTELGHEVYLYDGPDVQPLRNLGIKELVWDKNPFIKGVSSGPWNCGDLPGVEYKNTEKCFIMNAERMMGLEPRNWLPKIYYTPKDIVKFEGIIELSALHHKYAPETVIANAMELIRLRSDVKWIQLAGPNQSNAIQLSGIEQLEIKDIFQLCDVITNCKIFVSLLSGQHSLAAAIQHINIFEQHCFIPAHDAKQVMESQKFVYPNVKYIVS